jgi:hypothetical protein
VRKKRRNGSRWGRGRSKRWSSYYDKGRRTGGGEEGEERRRKKKRKQSVVLRIAGERATGLVSLDSSRRISELAA